MKRCPECRRNYYDDSLLYCLEDGVALLQGAVSSPDEPATAILSEPRAVATGFPADETAIFRSGGEAEPQGELGSTERPSLSAHRAAEPKEHAAPKRNSLIAGITGIALITALGFGSYFYYGRGDSNQIRSIAVLPFQNSGDLADSEYISDGLAESLIYRLTQIPDLKVSPRSSVFRYKGKDVDSEQIGAELGVDAVMSGRLVKRGDSITISVDLVDVRERKTLWGEQFERKMSDLLSTQREIASAITAKLQLKMSGEAAPGNTKRSTDNNEAYQAYLKGRYFWNRRTGENLKKAIEQFKVATDRDPNYALAYAGLADCYALLNEYSGAPLTETAKQAKTYAERAIAIDGSLAEPHATLGTVNKSLWRWEEAEKDFKRAIEINPNYPTAYHWYAVMLLNLGRKDEALVMIQRAHELDPLSSIITATVTWVHLTRNNYQESIENALRLIDLDPNFGIAHDNLGMAYLKTGRNAEALAAFEKAAQLTDRWGPVLGNLGYAYAATGRRAEALAIIKELEEKYTRNEASGFSVASVYVGLGDKDKVFEWLEKDFENGDGSLADITASVPLGSLRDDPRFKYLLRRMNLPE